VGRPKLGDKKRRRVVIYVTPETEGLIRLHAATAEKAAGEIIDEWAQLALAQPTTTSTPDAHVDTRPLVERVREAQEAIWQARASRLPGLGYVPMAPLPPPVEVGDFRLSEIQPIGFGTGSGQLVVTSTGTGVGAVGLPPIPRELPEDDSSDETRAPF
jgi:hypothetical protein